MWQEVYLSALLRAILYADDANYVSFVFFSCNHVGAPTDLSVSYSVSLDSASSTPSLRSRQSSASSQQPRPPSSRVKPRMLCSDHTLAHPLYCCTGWQLGSEPEIQVATVVSNHLTSGIMKYFGDAFRFGPAVNLFEKLVVKEGEVACLLAQSYLGMSEMASPS